MTALTPIRRVTTRDDLASAGITPEQIERLEILRNHYPYIEFIDSQRQLEKLRFLRWLIETGRVE